MLPVGYFSTKDGKNRTSGRSSDLPVSFLSPLFVLFLTVIISVYLPEDSPEYFLHHYVLTYFSLGQFDLVYLFTEVFSSFCLSFIIHTITSCNNFLQHSCDPTRSLFFTGVSVLRPEPGNPVGARTSPWGTPALWIRRQTVFRRSWSDVDRASHSGRLRCPGGSHLCVQVSRLHLCMHFVLCLFYSIHPW